MLQRWCWVHLLSVTLLWVAKPYSFFLGRWCQKWEAHAIVGTICWYLQSSKYVRPPHLTGFWAYRHACWSGCAPCRSMMTEDPRRNYMYHRLVGIFLFIYAVVPLLALNVFVHFQSSLCRDVALTASALQPCGAFKKQILYMIEKLLLCSGGDAPGAQYGCVACCWPTRQPRLPRRPH
jgi:hypothetical protein